MFDPLQWILQRRDGETRERSSGWSNRAYCVTRAGLLRCVREYCGEIDVDALALLRALPEWHPDRQQRGTPEAPLVGVVPEKLSPAAPDADQAASYGFGRPGDKPLSGDDYPLEFYEDGYPKLPACLDRRRLGGS